jgi:hypothetical protein
MSYIIGTLYVMYPDGSLVPCQNRGTAEYLINNTDAIAIRDITREIMTA